MGIRLEHMKGTIKEKVGLVTDDHGVEREGKREQVKSDFDAEVDDVIGVVNRAVGQAANRERTGT
jgi:uncharacterized protein YjbJ (UPF0337 family)